MNSNDNDDFDQEIDRITSHSFFQSTIATIPSPVMSEMQPDAWIIKIIDCGVEAYQASQDKKQIDLSAINVSSSITAQKFAQTQEHCILATEKFINEWIAFHKKYCPELSEVKLGNTAKRMMKCNDLNNFLQKLNEYFDDKKCVILPFKTGR